MLDSSLRNYVKVYKLFYDVDFCKQVSSSLDVANWKTHQFYKSKDGEDTFVSHEDELAVSHDAVPLKAELDKKIWNVISQYISKDMGYMKNWFDGWTGYSHSRFNRYTPETRMRLHCDHIQTLFDGERKGVPILSIVGALNEDYEGGEFMLCGERIELKTGDVIVFPSNFLYPHEVKSVTSGTRYSFVSWVW